MIEQSDPYRNKRGQKAVTEDTILHRMVVNPDVKKIQDQLKAKDQQRKVAKNGELRKSAGDRKRT